MSESSLNNYIKRSASTHKSIIPTFTFVRDPLARFKSGVAEAIFQALPIFQLNTTNVKNILQEFFALNDSGSSYGPLHRGTLLVSERFLHTMSGSLSEFDIDAIGTILLIDSICLLCYIESCNILSIFCIFFFFFFFYFFFFFLLLSSSSSS